MKLATLSLLALLTLSACGNTLSGMGQDMQNWGSAIQDTF